MDMCQHFSTLQINHCLMTCRECLLPLLTICLLKPGQTEVLEALFVSKEVFLNFANQHWKDNLIHWINHYPRDSTIGYVNTYQVDSDLSFG